VDHWIFLWKVFFAFLNNTNPIEDGQNFYHVILKYSPKKDETRVISYEIKNIISTKKSKEINFEKKMELKFA